MSYQSRSLVGLRFASFWGMWETLNLLVVGSIPTRPTIQRLSLTARFWCGLISGPSGKPARRGPQYVLDPHGGEALTLYPSIAIWCAAPALPRQYSVVPTMTVIASTASPCSHRSPDRRGPPAHPPELRRSARIVRSPAILRRDKRNDCRTR